MDSDLITPSRSSPESEALDQVVPAANSPSSTNATNAVVSGSSSYPSQLSPLSPRRLSRAVVVSAIAVVAILGIGSSLVFMLAGSHSPKLPSYKPTTSTLPSNSSGKLQLQDVLVNGQLYVNNGLVIAPTVEPGNPTVGQLYLSSVTKQLSYYNGSQFIALGSSTNTNLQGGSTTLQGATAGARGLQGPAGASGGTSTDASTLVSGTLSDNRLSPNVALLNRDSQTFHGRRQAFQNTANDLNAFSIQAADGTPELTVDTVNNTVTTTDLLPRVASNVNSGFTTNGLDISPSGANGVFTILGPDGFSRVAYDKSTALMFARCTNTLCSTKVTTTVETIDQPYMSAMTIGTDGFARIAYASGRGLIIVRCTNTDCSTSVLTIVDAAAANGNALNSGGAYGISIAMGTDGFPKIAYANDPAGTWKTYFADCTNADCTSPVIQVIDTNIWGDEVVGLVLGSDGFARITYEDNNTAVNDTNAFKLARCTNSTCSSPVITIVDNNTANKLPGCDGNVIRIGTDGYPRILYQDCGTNDSFLHYVQCLNADCTQLNNSTLESSAGTYIGDGMVLGSDGNARITYEDSANKFLQYDVCTNTDCSAHTTTLLDPTVIAADSGNSIIIGNDGFPGVAYSNDGANGVTYTKITTVNGQLINTDGSNIGSSSVRFGTFFNDSVNTQKLTVQSGINSTSAFQIQNTSGNSILSVDTANGSLGINGGDTTAGYALNVNGSTNISGPVSIGGASTNTGYALNVSGIVNASSALVNNLQVTSGGGLKIYNAGTNFIPDPTFANLISDLGRGSGTSQLLTSQPTATGRAVKITPNNDWTTVNEICALTVPGTYTMSFLAWTTGGSVNMSLLDGPSNIFANVVISGTTPKLYSATWQHGIYCNGFEFGPNGGTSPVIIADWQVESGNTASPFIYGGEGYGYNWISTVNNSASSRDQGIYGGGNLYINGNLEVTSTKFNGNITVNGHVITGNSSGSTIAAAGSNCGSGCTVSVAGNDTSGVITVNTGTSSAVGVQAIVTFANAYTAAPLVILTPSSIPASSNFPQYYYTSNNTTFSLKSYNTLTASSTYTFSYHIEQ